MTGRSQLVDEPYKALATAVIMQAIRDRRNPKLRAEVYYFFKSAWFEDICDLARVNPDVVREKLHIERKYNVYQ